MKKNYGVLLGVLALVVIAVFVNVRVNQNTVKPAAPTPTANLNATNMSGREVMNGGTEYFEAFREDRENVREKELAYLETILAHKDTDKETVQEAQAQKLAVVDGMEKEFTIESLLKAKGFSDVAVTFHKGSVNVIVKAQELSKEDVAQILDIACRETGEEAKNIKISTIYQ